MKKYVCTLILSLALVLVALIGLQSRPEIAPLAESDTVQPKSVPVGEYYVQVGSFTGLLGDFDDDGDITTTDARLILQAVVGKYGEATSAWKASWNTRCAWPMWTRTAT